MDILFAPIVGARSARKSANILNPLTWISPEPPVLAHRPWGHWKAAMILHQVHSSLVFLFFFWGLRHLFSGWWWNWLACGPPFQFVICLQARLAYFLGQKSKIRILENVSTGEIGELTDFILASEWDVHKLITHPSAARLLTMYFPHGARNCNVACKVGVGNAVHWPTQQTCTMHRWRNFKCCRWGLWLHMLCSEKTMAHCRAQELGVFC